MMFKILYIINIKLEINNNMEETEIKKEFNKGFGGRKIWFQEERQQQRTTVIHGGWIFFKDVGFCVGREGQEL